ncbi:hypothetical protein [Vulcanococcus limneticus]|uniref:hypothetical protein n=1 Tax=Vulcanococcus limneticus TaxID=2170428 RepID=UPI00398C150F
MKHNNIIHPTRPRVIASGSGFAGRVMMSVGRTRDSAHTLKPHGRQNRMDPIRQGILHAANDHTSAINGTTSPRAFHTLSNRLNGSRTFGLSYYFTAEVVMSEDAYRRMALDKFKGIYWLEGKDKCQHRNDEYFKQNQ